jgi:hypothetical protein
LHQFFQTPAGAFVWIDASARFQLNRSFLTQQINAHSIWLQEIFVYSNVNDNPVA